MAKSLIGIVTSDAAEKTISVQVTRLKTHPIYRKKYKIDTKFLAHDEKGDAKVGDKVRITESAPISKRKRWTLAEVIEKGEQL